MKMFFYGFEGVKQFRDLNSKIEGGKADNLLTLLAIPYTLIL